MSFTLSDLLQASYLELGQMDTVLATGGTTTTAIVGSLGQNSNDDDYNDGALFVIASTDGAAPQSEYGVVSDFTASTGTFTVDTALTASVGAGDTVGYTLPIYPLRTAVRLANRALSRIGDLVQVDTTTLTTASGQSEYDSSVDWQRTPPLSVRIQGHSDSDDNQWIEYHNWRYQPAAAGSTGKIIFSDYPITGAAVEVTYLAPHAEVTDYNDVIHESVHPELAIAATVMEMVQWNAGRMMGENDFTTQQYNDKRNEYERQRMLHPIWRPARSPKLFYIGESTRRYPGDRNPR